MSKKKKTKKAVMPPCPWKQAYAVKPEKNMWVMALDQMHNPKIVRIGVFAPAGKKGGEVEEYFVDRKGDRQWGIEYWMEIPTHPMFYADVWNRNNG